MPRIDRVDRTPRSKWTARSSTFGRNVVDLPTVKPHSVWSLRQIRMVQSPNDVGAGQSTSGMLKGQCSGSPSRRCIDAPGERRSRSPAGACVSRGRKPDGRGYRANGLR